MPTLLSKLTGGDRRSVGRVAEVVNEALADLAEQDPALRPEIIAKLETLTATGSPAMRNRGRKLLDRRDYLRET